MNAARISSDSIVGIAVVRLLFGLSAATSIFAVPVSLLGRGKAWAGWCLFLLSLVAFPLFILGFFFVGDRVTATSFWGVLLGLLLWLGPAAVVSWGIYAWYHPKQA